MRTPALEAAYRATAYCVDLPAGRTVLRIGQISRPLAAAVATLGSSEWAILCAANPGSCRLDAGENARRFAVLCERLREAGYVFWPGVNLADAGDWPAEASVCVPGLACGDALRLAGVFGQNAIVAGRADGVPELIWLEAPR